MFSITLYAIAVITLGSLIIIFYENLKSSLGNSFNFLKKEPAFSLSSSISFFVVITIIYGYTLSKIYHLYNPRTVFPHNPQGIYLHLCY